MIRRMFKNQPTVYNDKVCIYKFKGMKKFGPGTDFNKKVNLYFNNPIFSNRTKPSEQNGKGKAITSVGLNGVLPFFKSIGLEGTELNDWLKKTFYKAAKDMELPVDPKIHKQVFLRSWANRMYKEVSGNAHIHGNVCHLVGIFYYEVPKNSSKLIFVNEHIYDVPVDKLNKEKLEYLDPEPGMLVCHDPWIPHAVSEHGNELPRTCFVFDIQFPGVPLPKKQQ